MCITDRSVLFASKTRDSRGCLFTCGKHPEKNGRRVAFRRPRSAFTHSFTRTSGIRDAIPIIQRHHPPYCRPDTERTRPCRRG